MSGCTWRQIQKACLAIWAHGYDRLHPPYNATSLEAAQSWCCAQGPHCAGITFHGGGPQPTQHYDAMGRCGAIPVNYTDTTSWEKDPCQTKPAPVPPAPPLPPPPAVPADTPRLVFEEPVLIGAATATCLSCGRGVTRNSSAAPSVCGTVGYGWDAGKSHDFPYCGACCDNYFALNSSHLFGFNSRTGVGGGGFKDGDAVFPDRLPLFFSSNGGRSWAPTRQSINGTMITAITGPAALIPGPGATELHTTGMLSPQTEVDTATGSSTIVLRSNHSTVFSVSKHGELHWSKGRSVVFSGLNWCAPVDYARLIYYSHFILQLDEWFPPV